MNVDAVNNDGWILADPYPLSAGNLSLLTAMVAAVSPMDDGPQDEGLVDRVVEVVRIQLAYFRPALALGFIAGMWVLDLCPLWSFRGLRRLRSLPRKEAAGHLLRLERSHFSLSRQLVFTVRAATLSAYFDQPEVHAAMGYHPVPHMRERIALHQRIKAGGVGRDEDLLEPRSIDGAPPATVAAPHAGDAAAQAAREGADAGNPNAAEAS